MRRKVFFVILIIIATTFVFAIDSIETNTAAINNFGSDSYFEADPGNLISISTYIESELNGEPVVESETIVVATIAYRADWDAMEKVDRLLYNDSDYPFSRVCATADGEYGIEVWMMQAPSLGDWMNVDVEFLENVDSRFLAVNIFTGVDNSTPIGDHSCTNGGGRWVDPVNLDFQMPEATVNSSNNSLVFSAVMSYSDMNVLSPLSAYDLLAWENVYNQNIVTSALSVSGSASTTVAWEMSEIWPWAMFAISINEAGSVQEGDPEILITDNPLSFVEGSQEVTFAGWVSDPTWLIDSVEYELRNAIDNNLLQSGYINLSNESPGYADWTITLTDLVVGEYLFIVTAFNEVGNSDSEDFQFEISFPAPTCEMINLPVLQTNSQPTYTASCTDVMPISDISYRVYRVLGGFEINFATITNLTSGMYGDNAIEVEFTVSSPIPDGATIIELNATNSAGASISPGYRPVDYIVIETTDNKPPLLIFNQIIPNPTVKTRPSITGSCKDTYQFETNSNIDYISYRVNGGSWIEIPAFDGAYDGNIEIFSIQLPELDLGIHEIEVRCADTAGNSTNDNSSNRTQVIEIVTPTETEPEQVSFTEDFTTRIRNALAHTTAIWGNGIVRLRDTVDIIETPVDTAGFGGRYEPLIARSTYRMSEGTNGLIWYVKENEFVSYDRNTDTTTVYPATLFGIDEFNDIAQVQNSSGDILVWVTSRHGLLLFDVTNNNHTIYTTGSFWSSIYWPNRIAVDTRDGRVGAYIRLEEINSILDTRLVYIDTGTDFINTVDDSVRWVLPDGALDTSLAYHIMLDQNEDKLYVSTYLGGLGLLYDAGDPLTSANDIRSFLPTAGEVITDMTLDRDNNVMFVTDFIGSAFRVIDFSTNTDSHVISDSNVTTIAIGTELGGFTPEHIRFLPGPQYIGGQVFIGTREGVLIYYNTNGTYSDTLDDNLIVLDTAQNIYPLWISGLAIDNYNRLYVTKDRQGFFRVDLTRGWESTNLAVSIAGPSQDKQVINHISLENQDIIARINSDGVIVPTSLATVTNYISIDDGLNWEPISVGENKSLNIDDYRLQFRMDLSQNPGTTPIIDQYTLSFVSYAAPPTATQLQLSASPVLVETGQSFTLNTSARDSLSFVVGSYNETVSVSLINSLTNSVVNGLSLSSLEFVNGVASSIASISQPGIYTIRITDGVLTADSNLIVVTSIPIPPILNVGSQVPSTGSGAQAANFFVGQAQSDDEIQLDDISVSETGDFEQSMEPISFPVIQTESQPESESTVATTELTDSKHFIPLMILFGILVLYSGLILSSVANLSGIGGVLFGVFVPRKKKYYGQITDFNSGQSIGLVDIFLEDMNGNTVSRTKADENGLYRFEITQSGNLKMRFEIDGYKEQIIEDQFKAGEMAAFDVQMGTTTIEDEAKSHWRNFVSRQLKKLVAISTILLSVFGFIWSIYALVVSFSILNLAIVLLYPLIIILHFDKSKTSLEDK